MIYSELIDAFSAIYKILDGGLLSMSPDVIRKQLSQFQIPRMASILGGHEIGTCNIDQGMTKSSIL